MQIESLKSQKKSNRCKKHEGQGNNLYCYDCAQLICYLCTGKDGHEGHETVSVKDAADKKKGAIKELGTALNSELSTMMEKEKDAIIEKKEKMSQLQIEIARLQNECQDLKRNIEMHEISVARVAQEKHEIDLKIQTVDSFLSKQSDIDILDPQKSHQIFSIYKTQTNTNDKVEKLKRQAHDLYFKDCNFLEAYQLFNEIPEESKDGEVYFHLAMCLHPSGKGSIPKDLFQANRYFAKAFQNLIDCRAPNEMYCLAKMYQSGFFVKENIKEAFRLYKISADEGYGNSQNNIAALYEAGVGTTKNFSEACRYYKLAADQGYANAIYNLARMKVMGEGIPRNLEEAVRLYKEAAEKGHASAILSLGFMYDKGEGVRHDPEEAARYFKLAADNCDNLDPIAQNSLGELFDEGYGGFEKNHKMAVKLYTRPAEMGIAVAQCNLAMCYENGEGVPYDLKEAFKYYTLAANQNNATAQFNLGVFYSEGKGTRWGIPKDRDLAIKWYKLAAAQNYAPAIFNIAVHYEEMYEGLYGDNPGVINDWIEAYRLYKLAAAQGDPDAIEKMSEINQTKLKSLFSKKWRATREFAKV